jgi:hypothetical protein
MSQRKKIYLWCFLVAFALRIIVIFISHSANSDIDLGIYRDAGQLVVNGINPYDFKDNVALREKLRTDKDSYNEYVSQNQETWDYYANSNLPLATLFFGCVEFCYASPLMFRYTFALFDSFLAVLILAFVLNKWNYQLPDNKLTRKLPSGIRKDFPLYLGLSLGAVSPMLLLWGALIPEPKGIGLMLILASVYFSDSTNKKLSLGLSPVILGFSVAFIGLGVFIAPLCLYNIYKNNEHWFRGLLFYGLISLAACIICLVPFLPELITMMSNRISGATATEPYHGSMWLQVFNLFPGGWLLIRNIFIALFAGISIIGFFRKRLDVTMLSANLLYLFTCIYLMNGSMDRMNIAIASLILLSGYSRIFLITNVLWLFYFTYGGMAFCYSYIFGNRQDFDGVFVLLFTFLYFTLLIIQTFFRKSTSYETVSNYSRP